jgi:CheY-like chemotaxis protein
MPYPSFRPTHSRTIVLVEDDDLLRRSISRLLVRKNYRTLCFRSAYEAFKQIIDGLKFDLLLTDWELNEPDWDGLSLAMNLRRIPEFSSPIILWSRNERIFDEVLNVPRSLRPDAVLNKSDVEKMIQRITALLGA